MTPEGLLADYVFGTASAAERAQVEAAVASSVAVAARLRDLETSMSELNAGLVAPPAAWKRVAARLEGGQRFGHLVPQLAELFDVPPAEAQVLLDALDGHDGWFDGPGPGLSIFPVMAGPRCDGFMAAVLKLQPGAVFPHHEHGATERVLVLEGGYRDVSGAEFWRGALDVRAPGTAHHFTALEGLPCLCASVTKAPEDD